MRSLTLFLLVLLAACGSDLTPLSFEQLPPTGSDPSRPPPPGGGNPGGGGGGPPPLVFDDSFIDLGVDNIEAVSSVVAFTAVIDAEQAGGGGRTGMGTGHFAYDARTNELEYDITFEGLSGTETVSHIHGPAEPVG